nr:hypothetical protein [Streptomyces canus]
MVVLERREPCEEFGGDREAVGGQLLDGGVDAEALEEHHGVEGQAEGAERVLHPSR